MLCGCRTSAREPGHQPSEASASHLQPTASDPLLRASEAIVERMQGPRDFSHLSEPERNFIVAWVLSGEVGNGGFDQYFFNTSGDQATLAPAALRAVGAADAAALAEQANMLFGAAGPPADRAKRWAAMDTIPESTRTRWTELDEQFYKISDLDAKLLAYITAHEDEFSH
ncbi:MAG: DUF4375 domain-containing protein [Thermoanaerobaculia bacterium]